MSRRQDGFTIIELLIATMVFSVILLAATSALFQLQKMYYRGIVTNRTQTAARQVMNELTRQLQLNQNRVRVGTALSYGVGAGHYQSFCIDNLRYSYALNVQVTNGLTQYKAAQHQGPHALWRDTITSTGDCTPLNLGLANPADTKDGTTMVAIGGQDGSELLGQNMRLSQLSISDNDCLTSLSNTKLCTISVGIIYGDDDLLSPNATNPVGCQTTFGGQWCAAANLSTKVFKRL